MPRSRARRRRGNPGSRPDMIGTDGGGVAGQQRGAGL